MEQETPTGDVCVLGHDESSCEHTLRGLSTLMMLARGVAPVLEMPGSNRLALLLLVTPVPAKRRPGITSSQ